MRLLLWFRDYSQAIADVESAGGDSGLNSGNCRGVGWCSAEFVGAPRRRRNSAQRAAGGGDGGRSARSGGSGAVRRCGVASIGARRQVRCVGGWGRLRRVGGRAAPSREQQQRGGSTCSGGLRGELE